ncbi:hypothetical protein MLD52_17605 [Puniceicoccaceae bacterium K14]|nr:hypothetical protein [Puniceicoccaceae bacterium K14]
MTTRQQELEDLFYGFNTRDQRSLTDLSVDIRGYAETYYVRQYNGEHVVPL